jgi:hypothetical protein
MLEACRPMKQSPIDQPLFDQVQISLLRDALGEDDHARDAFGTSGRCRGGMSKDHSSAPDRTTWQGSGAWPMPSRASQAALAPRGSRR